MTTYFRSPLSHVVFLAMGIAIGSFVEPSTHAAQASPAVGKPAAPDVMVLRYMRIKKGSFPEVYRLSEEGVWPYYERAGARQLGMWQAIYPDVPGQTQRENPDYDEAYLLTRYTSVEHWAATRSSQIDRLGGHGPDFTKLLDALKQRTALTQESETKLTFLRGRPAANGPYFYSELPK